LRLSNPVHEILAVMRTRSWQSHGKNGFGFARLQINVTTVRNSDFPSDK
jgi:hypothetical protein